MGVMRRSVVRAVVGHGTSWCGAGVQEPPGQSGGGSSRRCSGALRTARFPAAARVGGRLGGRCPTAGAPAHGCGRCGGRNHTSGLWRSSPPLALSAFGPPRPPDQHGRGQHQKLQKDGQRGAFRFGPGVAGTRLVCLCRVRTGRLRDGCIGTVRDRGQHPHPAEWVLEVVGVLGDERDERLHEDTMPRRAMRATFCITERMSEALKPDGRRTTASARSSQAWSTSPS